MLKDFIFAMVVAFVAAAIPHVILFGIPNMIFRAMDENAERLQHKIAMTCPECGTFNPSVNWYDKYHCDCAVCGYSLNTAKYAKLIEAAEKIIK